MIQTLKKRHSWWHASTHVNTKVSNVPEHAVGVQGGQPVAIGIRVVVARPPAVTLDEGHLAEAFQTRARRNQRLGGAVCTSTSLLVWVMKIRGGKVPIPHCTHTLLHIKGPALKTILPSEMKWNGSRKCHEKKRLKVQVPQICT